MDHNHNEMTRYAFMSNMEDYMKQLLKNPGTGKVSDFLRGYGIDEPKALELLLTPTVEDNPDSVIMKRVEKIVTGKDGVDKFFIRYSLPRKDYRNKMRNLYISLFESNIIKDMKKLNEEDGGGMSTMGAATADSPAGATSAESSGQFLQPLTTQVIKQEKPSKARNKKKTVYFTESQIREIKSRLREEASIGGMFGNIGYDAPPFAKSNDPAYYHKDMIKSGIKK